MPRYHFNIEDDALPRDDEGTDLADLATARSMAVHLVGSLLEERAHTLVPDKKWHMDVADGGGMILFSLTFLVADVTTIWSPPLHSARLVQP